MPNWCLDRAVDHKTRRQRSWPAGWPWMETELLHSTGVSLHPVPGRASAGKSDKHPERTISEKGPSFNGLGAPAWWSQDAKLHTKALATTCSEVWDVRSPDRCCGTSHSRFGDKTQLSVLVNHFFHVG